MDNKNNYDEIDREISKTYFAHSVKKLKKKLPETETKNVPCVENSPDEQKISPPQNNPVPPEIPIPLTIPPVPYSQPIDKMEKANRGSKRSKKPLFLLILILALTACTVSVALYYSKDKIFFLAITDKKGTQLAFFGKAQFSFNPFSPAKVIPTEGSNILFDFENDKGGWEIPSWAMDQPDHVAISLKHSDYIASNGKGSIECLADFPGGEWSGAFIEIPQYFDLGKYLTMAADIYIPPACPKGLKTKLILTVGDDWKFIEMSRYVSLVPGKWVTLSADLSDTSKDFRSTEAKAGFRSDIRKLGIRVESFNKPVYKGPFYVDCVRVYGEKK
ncbi:MAG: hypothetical protein HQL30_06030 [Candidatus Omnitrophica bacterium]|nr:hypothetical protein [Candidatus Omnitrophota bacterium]